MIGRLLSHDHAINYVINLTINTKNRKFIKHTILKIEFHNKKSLFFERLEPELKIL